jgi:site-specific recombinase XerD
LARIIGENSPEHVEWCAQIRLIPFKKTTSPSITYLDKPEMDALLAAPDRRTPQGQRDYALLLFLYNSGSRASEAATLRIADIDWHAQSVRFIAKGCHSYYISFRCSDGTSAYRRRSASFG